MKYIDKYNKFIKLNEDVEINGDIDEYDLSIIKDGLIELEDLGFCFSQIIKNDNGFYIELNIKTSKFSNDSILWKCKFNKEKFYSEIEKKSVKFYNAYSSYIKYMTNEYERDIINVIKDRSLFLINMLGYNHGRYRFIKTRYNTYFLLIDLSKTKLKE